MEIIKQIKVLNRRSEFAYQEYFKNRKYYQAKRIYSANKEILDLLREFQFLCEEDLLEDVNHYIFHLEDWFLQFYELEKRVEDLDDNFVFERLEHSFKFPRVFYKKI